MSQTFTHDVLVVGAGPTGLSLAAALQVMGIDVKIVEMKPHLSETTKATNLMQGTQEQLSGYGLLHPMYDMAGKMKRMMMHAYGTNLGPRTMHLPESPFADVLLLGQDRIEKSLAETLINGGASIHFNTRLAQLNQNSERVEVTLLSADLETKEAYKYVVACDGPWSTTRTFTTCDFAPVKTGRAIRQVDARLKWKRLKSLEQIFFFYFAEGFAVVVPLLDNYYRILTIEPKENMPARNPTLEEMQNKLIEVTEDDSIELTDAKWFSYTDLNMGIAPKLIDGRVIVAGDAGNPILPNGGQGLNTGIQDSLNLGWKLASMIRGEANPKLLNTYEEERLPLRAAMEKVQFNSLKYTTKAPKFMQFLFKKLGNYLLDKGGEYQMAKAFSQLGVNYRKSPLTINKLKKGGIQAGDRIHDADVVEATTLTEVSLFTLLSKPNWKCVYFDNGVSEYSGIQSRIADLAITGLQAMVITLKAQNKYTPTGLYYDLDGVAHKIYGIQKPTILLVRPDQYIAVKINPRDWETLENFSREWLRP